MAMVASPSFLKDMQVNWGSISSVSHLELHHGQKLKGLSVAVPQLATFVVCFISLVVQGEEASRAMETVQAKSKQPEDSLLWRLHPPGVCFRN